MVRFNRTRTQAQRKQWLSMGCHTHTAWYAHTNTPCRHPAHGFQILPGTLHYRDNVNRELKTTSLLDAVEATGTKNRSPHVGLLFFNLSCPIWRKYADYFLDAFQLVGIPLMMIYIRESHPCDEYPSLMNSDEWQVT